MYIALATHIPSFSSSNRFYLQNIFLRCLHLSFFPCHYISSGLHQVWINHHDCLLTNVHVFMLTPNSYPIHFCLVARSLLSFSVSNVAPSLMHSSEPCTSLSPVNWLTSFLPWNLCSCHPLYKSCSFSSFRASTHGHLLRDAASNQVL